MAKYRWTLEIEVEADNEEEAQSRVEECLVAMLDHEDGVFSYAEMKRIWPAHVDPDAASRLKGYVERLRNTLDLGVLTGEEQADIKRMLEKRVGD